MYPLSKGNRVLQEYSKVWRVRGGFWRKKFVSKRSRLSRWVETPGRGNTISIPSSGKGYGTTRSKRGPMWLDRKDEDGPMCAWRGRNRIRQKDILPINRKQSIEISAKRKSMSACSSRKMLVDSCAFSSQTLLLKKIYFLYKKVPVSPSMFWARVVQIETLSERAALTLGCRASSEEAPPASRRLIQDITVSCKWGWEEMPHLYCW